MWLIKTVLVGGSNTDLPASETLPTGAGNKQQQHWTACPLSVRARLLFWFFAVEHLDKKPPSAEFIQSK